MTARLAGIVSAILFITTTVYAREGTLTNYHGVWVMNLYGSRTEMARQHGQLIAGRVANTALPFFANKISTAIKQTYIIKDFPFLAWPATAAIDLWVGRPLRHSLPSEDRAVLKAFAKAAKFPTRDVLNAAVVPDVGQWLTSLIFHKNNVMGGAFSNLGAFGCSSFVIPGSTNFVHARNLDYESYGVFDKNAVVIYFHPDQGEQTYTSISSLGIHTAGITATNESGLTIELHQTFVNATSRTGTPIITVTDRAIRQAHTFDQALRILTSAQYAGSWAIVVSSARENRAAVIEVSADGNNVRDMNGKYLVMTNHVLTPLMKKKEFAVDYAATVETHERFALLDRVAREMSETGRTDAQSAIDLISNGPVAKLNNIQSVVFLPRQNTIYLGVPTLNYGEPTNGNYVALPLDGKFETFGTLPDLTRSQPLGSNQITARALLRQASALATEEGKFLQAGRLLTRAAKSDTTNPEYPFLAALSYFHAAPEFKTATGRRVVAGYANELLLQALNLNPNHYLESLIRLFHGRYLDSLHTHDGRLKALEQYALVNTQYSKPLRNAVTADIKSRYGVRDFRKIAIDYMRCDLFRF